MIVATAGHVDHGKTLLVKAITGVDTDRLPEEKSRGMSIDLGFAYWQAGPARIGFVDVPGHERFIKNMLAGVAGIDFVLLAIAADDGVMPQSREHAAIVELLGVRHGAVALTKIDRVPQARVAAVTREIEALLLGTGLAQAPIVPVSAVTGDGVARLKDLLAAAASPIGARAARGNFRLAIDRAFTIAGAGIVVTGTVYAGMVAIGDGVRLLRAGGAARVRQIHAQNQAAREGRAGERCALNLAGDLALGEIERGDWVVSDGAPEPVDRFDLRLDILASEPRPLAHWTPVHAHVGAAEATARVALLDRGPLAPGQSGLAQLVLDRPLGAVHGDRVILRDQSAQRTIGGGTVIDIFPPRRGRARPERIAALRILERDDKAALAGLVDAAPHGVDLARFAQGRNLARAEMDALLAAVPMRVVAGAAGFAPAAWQRLKADALETLAHWHRRAPHAAGPADERLFAAARLSRAAAASIAAELVAEGAAVRDGAGLRLAAHQPTLSAPDAALWGKLGPLIRDGGLRPPSLHELAQATRADAKTVAGVLGRAARLGLVVRAAPNRFFRPDALRRLGEIAAELADAAPQRRVTAASFRDRAGVGRNVAIELLEYFDRIRFTRRVGDAHEVVRSVAEALGEG